MLFSRFVLVVTLGLAVSSTAVESASTNYKGNIGISLSQKKKARVPGFVETEPNSGPEKLTNVLYDHENPLGNCFVTKKDIKNPFFYITLGTYLRLVKKVVFSHPKGSGGRYSVMVMRENPAEMDPRFISGSYNCSRTTELSPTTTIQSFDCSNSAIGRYVLVIRSVTTTKAMKNRMAVCGVDVTGVVLQNLAYNSETRQSSTAYGGLSRLAVDDNWSTYYKNKYTNKVECTHTNDKGALSWWESKLPKNSAVYAVQIANRKDCCSHRLAAIDLQTTFSSIADKPNETLIQESCKYLPHKLPPGVTFVTCDHPVYGSYFSIKKYSPEALTLCEVGVYGTLDVCRKNPCGEGHCHPVDGYNYTCKCKKGAYVWNQKCINPCKNNKCKLGKCIPSGPGYTCRCPKHHRLIEDKATLTAMCLIDQCHNRCTTKGSCIYVDNTRFKCNCDPGFEEVNGQCVDIDECKQKDICGRNAICTNFEGSYSCDCSKYHRRVGKNCEPVDQCTINNGGCNPNGRCSDGLGKVPKCSCIENYKLNDDGKCRPINFCRSGTHTCLDDDLCRVGRNGVGFTCDCPKGFSKDGQKNDGECQDIDECATGQNNCSENAKCVNTNGSYTCTCKEYYEGDGKLCRSTVACKKDNGGCDPNATCIQEPGKPPRCQCNSPQFEGNGQTCKRVDPCKLLKCDINAKCHKKNDVEAECRCNKYFSGNGETCVAVNQCTVSPSVCDTAASCSDGWGKVPKCKCYPFFYGDGKNCRVGDLCKKNECDKNAFCVQEIDRVRCTCNPYYRGDGRTCESIFLDYMNMTENSTIKLEFFKAPTEFFIDFKGCAKVHFDGRKHTVTLSSSFSNLRKEQHSEKMYDLNSVLLLHYENETLSLHALDNPSNFTDFQRFVKLDIKMESCIVKSIEVTPPTFEKLNIYRTTNIQILNDSSAPKYTHPLSEIWDL